MAEKKVTIYDVAKHCGVSVATVSRIVNNVDYPVSAELRTRVQASVRELKYKPNMLGRYLKSRSTGFLNSSSSITPASSRVSTTP